MAAVYSHYLIMHDGELLRDYMENRSEAAFASLVERHVNLVYSAAMRQLGGNVENAKDVTQKVFVHLARKADSLSQHPVLIGWLYRAVRLEVLAWRRAEARRVRRERIAGLELGEMVGGEAEEIDWSRLKPVIDEVLLELNERDRLAVLLRIFAGQPLSVVGATLGIGENAARMRVERALEKLKNRLGRRGITSTTGALSMLLGANAIQAAPALLVPGIANSVVAAGSVGMLAAFTNYFLMSKVQLTIAGVVLVLLAGGASWELRGTARLKDELTARRTEVFGKVRETAPGQSSDSGQSLAPPVDRAEEKKTGRKREEVLISRKLQDRSYAALFRHLRLPAAELDRLKDLLANRENDTDRARVFVRKTGLLELTESENEQIKAVVNGTGDDAIHELLGEEAYRYFQKYDRTLYVRRLLTPYMDEMRQLGDPLTDSQADHFVDLLHSTSPSMIQQLHEAGNYQIPDSAIDAVAEFLTPRQIERLETLQNEQAAEIRLATLNRLAAQQGKLELTEQSARDYPGSPVAHD